MGFNNDIDAELSMILSGRYGSDIRLAIHDAIEKLWNLAKSKEGGGDTPTPPTPPPTPTEEEYLTLIFPLLMSDVSLSDLVSGKIIVPDSDIYTRIRYMPLTSSTPPANWDETYMNYYTWTTYGTYTQVPQSSSPPTYEPNVYFSRASIAPTNLEKYHFTLVRDYQEMSGWSGTASYTRFTGEAWLMIAYASSSYTGGFAIAKDIDTTAQPRSVRNGSYDNGWYAFPEIDGQHFYFSNTQRWRGGDGRYGVYDSTSLAYNWASLPIALPGDPTTLATTAMKDSARAILEAVGAIKGYVIVNDLTAPSDWDTDRGRYYRFDDESGSPTWHDYVSISDQTEYVPGVFYRRLE